MPESKGLLYNIFKRYLATDEQRNFLINKERIEKWKLEEEKKRNYSSNNIFKKEEVQVDKIKEKQKSESDIKDLVEYKDSFIKRIFNKIASFFKK